MKDEEKFNERLLTFVLIMVGLFAFAVTAHCQILRPPTINTCDKCAPIGSFWCKYYPAECERCWLECGTVAGPPPRRVGGTGAPYDMWLGDYSLPKEIAVTQVHHEMLSNKPPALQHMTNLDFAWEVWAWGFDAIKIWIEEAPFNCGGSFDWTTYYGVEMHTPPDDEREDMIRFWHEAPQSTLIIRPTWMAWTGDEQTDQVRLTHMQGDFYAITKRLYQEIGDYDKLVILTDWEQDWLYEAYDNYTIARIEQRQFDVERARREAFMERGYRPKLRVMHAVIVNKFPANGAEVGTTLAERIPKLKFRPDIIGLSYWKRGVDPRETITWLTETTGYPASRIYIDELGADQWEQPQRFVDYIPAFRDAGVDLISIWLWKQTWCDPEHNRGLWLQQQPCQGKPIFTEPSPGLEALYDLD